KKAVVQDVVNVHMGVDHQPDISGPQPPDLKGLYNLVFLVGKARIHDDMVPSIRKHRAGSTPPASGKQDVNLPARDSHVDSCALFPPASGSSTQVELISIVAISQGLGRRIISGRQPWHVR